MRITVPLSLLCLFLSVSTYAQTTYSVKGSVTDSSSNSHLINATVCILNAKDSTLRGFTRAGENGSFNIWKLNKGKFILLVSYPNYADYTEPFQLDSVKPAHDFSKLFLSLKSKILHDVIIKGTVAAIKIKGDTTEFNAKAYTIQPNSKVEDLLKQLPGITVDQNGKITAQGQTVPKVLVDGEEFFGDDPTLVTKNIRGDMVDKVQLYDKKSDQAAFTGIDDGQKTKTINIVLKEDKKDGYFGKLDGGLGTDGYYSAQALYNRFKGKKKLAIYGITSNTGKVGLGWEDSNKYGTSGLTTEFGDDGSMYFSISGSGSDLDSFDGRYNGQGIPVARTGGIHFDNKWDSDKKSINTNYKNGYIEVNGTENDQSQNTLPGNSIKSNSDQSTNKSVFRQKLDFTYQVKLDTSATLKLSIDGTLKTSKNRDNYASVSTNGGDTLLNKNNRNITNNVDGQLFDATALYTKKFKKVGRTFSLNVNTKIDNSDAKGYLYSDLKLYHGAANPTDSVTDQYKTTLTKNTLINSNATYTEPFTKKLSLILNYGLSNDNSSADRESFNQSAPGNYNVLDPRYSNNYTLNQLANTAGATLNYHGSKTTVNVGTKVIDESFDQTDQNTGIVFKRNFLNWNPNASYQYRFTKQSSLRLSYRGNTDQPSIDQIQPVHINNDPLNISLGNPDLRPSFRSNFGLNYNSYKVLSDQSLYLYGNYSFTSNAIISSNTSDPTTGKTTYQSINLTNRTPYSYYLNANAGQKVKLLGINVSVQGSANGNRSYNYVNGTLNTTTSNSYSGQLAFSKYREKKFDFNISAGPGYTFGGTSLQPNINNNGYTFSGNSYLNIYLPGKLQFSADGNYDYRGVTQSFNQTFSKLIVNSGITKNLLKGDNLKLALSVNDLFNQNQGFDRNSYNGNITQNSYTTIKRYFMFSITWDFSKMGGPSVAKEEEN